MILLLLTLLDGSAVNLRTDNFNFKIESKYGVMTIPANDLLDARIGVHYDDESEFISAYAQLAHDTFGSRDKATKFLAKNQRGAYKYVLLGLKSTDQEVVKRSQDLWNSYGGHFPVVDDEIVVGEGAIKGTIKNEFIEGTSESLGALKVRMSQIANISLKSFTKVSLRSGADWVPFGFVRGKVSITVTGRIDLWPQTPGQYVTEPTGLLNNQVQNNGYNVGAVIGMVGKKTFLVGAGIKTDNMDSGMLYLRVNPAAWAAAPITEGAFEVRID